LRTLPASCSSAPIFRQDCGKLLSQALRFLSAAGVRLSGTGGVFDFLAKGRSGGTPEGAPAQYTFSSSNAMSSASVTRRCCIESRSRRVKVPSFSMVSKSMVTHHGVPISSWRR